MLMTSTKTVNYNAMPRAIYTRDNQLRYKQEMESKDNTIKISQGKIIAVIILIAFLIFASCAGMLYFKSLISQKQIEINHINSQIRGLEQENSRLVVEKISAINIEKIKTSAEAMGMTLPDAEQVQYVLTVGYTNDTALKND